MLTFLITENTGKNPDLGILENVPIGFAEVEQGLDGAVQSEQSNQQHGQDYERTDHTQIHELKNIFSENFRNNMFQNLVKNTFFNYYRQKIRGAYNKLSK